jgi:NAD-dependent dihydropyrimidine dehydrogenase PreA subunit
MIRRVIQIDEAKCNGCGKCVHACHEGAIGLVDGKAHLMRDDYCDGLGDCLPNCPTGAISFIEREAAAYDEAAVKAAQKTKKQAFSGCPGSAPRRIGSRGGEDVHAPAQLCNWPVQIRLAPVKAAYFDGADLLVAADCSAYAYGNFHNDFIKGRVTLVGCPKLDPVDYAEKLGEILAANDIKSVTLTRMQVPCCGGLQMALTRAIAATGKKIPLHVVTISNDGNLVAN